MISAQNWLQKLPWWLQPIVPGLLGMVNELFAIIGLYFLNASVFEILSDGLRLVATALATRWLRRRLVPRYRSVGIAVITAALILVASSTVIFSGSGSGWAVGGANWRAAVGIAFLLGDIGVGSIKEIFSEIILQETGLSGMLLFGMTGTYSAAFALPIFIGLGPYFGIDLVSSFRHASGSAFAITMPLAILVASSVAETFLTMLIGVTSAMTQNVWRNLRSLVIWVISLGVFYGGAGASGLGEAWASPASYLVLTGYAMLIGGLFIYYK